MTVEQHRDQISQLLYRLVEQSIVEVESIHGTIGTERADSISTLSTCLTELDSHIRAEARADDVHQAMMAAAPTPFSV